MEAKAQNISVTKEEVDEKIAKAAEQYGGIDFEQTITSYGYSMNAIREDIEKSRLLKS